MTVGDSSLFRYQPSHFTHFAAYQIPRVEEDSFPGMRSAIVSRRCESGLGRLSIEQGWVQ